MYALPINLWTDLLVNLDADCSFCDVEDHAGATMVDLVRHTFVLGSIHFDVDVLAHLKVAEEDCQWDETLVN